MGKYTVESDFDDLHGNPDDAPDLELDLSDEDNPIILAAKKLGDDTENWTPPDEDDEEDDDEKDGKKFVDDDEDDDDLDELEDDDEDEDDEDDEKEESEDEDDDEDEDDEDDDAKYSRNVRKRIERERSARRRDKEESDRKFVKLQRQLKHRDAKDEFAEEERESKRKIKDLKASKVDALDLGDTAKAVDIDEKILDIKTSVKTKKDKLEQFNEDVDDSTETPDIGRKWLNRYPQFNTSKTFREVVLAADTMVASRHFDRNTEEYYEEIEKIIQPQFPNIVKKRAKVRNKSRRKTNKSAVGKTTRSGTRRNSSKGRRGKIRLTKDDQREMEAFGLDPKNPVHAKSWANNGD